MINNEKELFALVDLVLKPHGYIKKKDTWYLRTDECICFFIIRKSDFGGKYEPAMGCFLKDLIETSSTKYPPHFKNHLIYSLEYFVDKGIINRTFDLDSKNFIKDDREIAIKDLIEKYVLSFLEDVSSKDGILNSLNKYNMLKYWIRLPLKNVLGIADKR